MFHILRHELIEFEYSLFAAARKVESLSPFKVSGKPASSHQAYLLYAF